MHCIVSVDEVLTHLHLSYGMTVTCASECWTECWSGLVLGLPFFMQDDEGAGSIGQEEVGSYSADFVVMEEAAMPEGDATPSVKARVVLCTFKPPALQLVLRGALFEGYLAGCG